MDEKQIKILLVDDEPDFVAPMSFWLESKGYSVNAAYDGPSAIEIIKKNPPDIVFLDINMPLMSGSEVLKRVREFNKDLPVIIITAYVEDPRAKEASTYGVSGIFYKGKDFDEGLSLLEAALRTHRKLKK